MTDTAGIPGDRICSLIERVEHIDEEIKTLNEGKKEVFAEAKGEGFDVKVLREILRLRKQDKDSATNRGPCSTCISRPWRGLAHRKQGRRSAKRRRTSGRSRRFGVLRSHRLLQARPCEVAASSCAPLVDQRAQEAGWPTGDLENQIRGPAVVFGIRLPRALTPAFVNQALKASEGVAGLSAAMRGLIAARTAVMTAVAAIHADMRRSLPSRAFRRGP
jgi:uncharacterized protein (UPF0335 family)